MIPKTHFTQNFACSLFCLSASRINVVILHALYTHVHERSFILESLRKPGSCGRARECARVWVDPLSWLLCNKRLEDVHFVKLLHTSSNRLLLIHQDKGSTPSLAHSLAFPSHDPDLHNLTSI